MKRTTKKVTPVTSPQQAMRNQKTQTITKLGCCPGGEITCRIEMMDADTHLMAGSEPVVRVAIFNHSTTRIETIKLKLKQRSLWHVKGKKRKGRPSEEVSRTLSKTTVPLEATTTSDTMIADFVMPPLPEKTLDTFQSDRHYVRHELTVTLTTELGYSNVVMNIPVDIGNDYHTPGFATNQPKDECCPSDWNAFRLPNRRHRHHHQQDDTEEEEDITHSPEVHPLSLAGDFISHAVSGF